TGASARGLPLLLLLCTDEFRTYLAGQRPPLRPLRPDSVDQELHAELPLAGLEDATLNRLGELVTEGARTLRLTLDVLARPPVRRLRRASVGRELQAELPRAGLEDAPLNRLGELVTEGARTLRLTLDVLGYAPVGPLHLGLWRVAEARLA